ncbi:hypothetical protein G6514_005730 [Epicoccum nigrum]|nr:hypothetical protein G6514_005730 [Epicoccum nigrum]
MKVASGKKSPQALKGDSILPSRILWASEASWLSAALNQLVNHLDLDEIDHKDTLMAGAKVVYFVQNDINDTNIESLLRTLGEFPANGLKFARIRDDFVEVLVANTLLQWLEENPEDDFAELSQDRRQQVWETAYDRDRSGMCIAMWKPDHAKIVNLRIMLKVKFVFACEQVFQWRFNQGLLPGAEITDFRIGGVSLKQELKNGRGFGLHPDFRDVVVGYDSVPVTRD